MATADVAGDRELETRALHKVQELSVAVDEATTVGDVVCALHSLAVLLFPVDSTAVADTVDVCHRSKISNASMGTDIERARWCSAFYHGPAFPAISEVLLSSVALKWLQHFETSARTQVYDSFFTKGPSIEIVQSLVPALSQKWSNKDVDFDIICINVERLLVLCLLENEGVSRMVQELSSFRNDCTINMKKEGESFLVELAQLVASIPDKTRLRSSKSLSSSKFFKKVSTQLLVAAEESAILMASQNIAADQISLDPAFQFVGETLSRVCRRGSAGVVVAAIIPRIHDLARHCSSADNIVMSELIGSIPQFHFWAKFIELMKDQHSVERLSEEMLPQLASHHLSDEEAYWVLYVLFDRSFKHIPSRRTLFIDKFVLRKVFPICCLRWILQYAVFECPPAVTITCNLQKSSHLLSTLHRLISIWSRREFVQSSPMEHQAYITAAIGLCLEKTNKTELEMTKDILNLILQGVGSRLESPDDLVRKMASAIALVFSKVVDPKNPLYLDDNFRDTVDWAFGVQALRSKPKPPLQAHKINDGDPKSNGVEGTTSMLESATLDNGHIPENDNKEDVNFDASSDTSLEPYDLSDDDTDLQKEISQLGDLAAALRKTDDPDGVERAISVAEKLVRAAPDELIHISRDLVRALVHLRCTDMAAEGEEDSAEEKRQKALVALAVTQPFESVEVLTELLYSSRVDISQRILIIDVMTDAAQELADTKIFSEPRRNLISATSQSWFVPSNRGPSGAGPWRELSEPGTSTPISWYHRYEREVPLKPGQVKSGKSRRWSLAKPKNPQAEESRNRFPSFAAAFMLPAMKGFDKRSHGVDFLNRDFIVLGKLIHMLGVCIKCTAMHPEASNLAPVLLDMIKTRSIACHAEAYVRRSALFAASCILISLHPSAVASSLIEGNQDFTNGLEWIRIWAHQIAESDVDTECSSMAVKCLQLHSEMALQVSRVLEAADQARAQNRMAVPKLGSIKIPFGNLY